MMQETEQQSGSWAAIYRNHAHLFNPAILVVLILLSFGWSVGHGFVWDDRTLILNSDIPAHIQTPSSIFSRSFWNVSENVQDVTRSFYRPLVTLSYMLDFAIWGFNPSGFHITNILLHILVSLLVYAIAFRLLKSTVGALLAALVFAVHPTHVENVCWIAGRTDVICGLFFFLALYLLLRWCEGGGSSAILSGSMAMAYLLALLGKEMAVTFPLVALVYYTIGDRQTLPWRRFAVPMFILILITGIYMLMRLVILGDFSGPPMYGDAWQRVVSIPVVFAKYLGLLMTLLPVDPHHAEGMVDSLANVNFLLPATVSLVFAAFVVTVCVSFRRTLCFPFVLVPVTLLPVFNLATFGDILYADRFLYIPSFGFAVGIIALAFEVSRNATRVSRSVKVAVGVLFLVFAGSMILASWDNCRYWKNNLTLFSHAVKTSQRSAYIHFNLANSLRAERRLPEACQEYSRAIYLSPDYPEAFYNMGVTLKESGMHEHAITYLSRSIEIYEERLSGRAIPLLLPPGMHDPSLDYRRRVLTPSIRMAYKDGQCQAMSQIGDTYRQMGMLSKAIQAYQVVVAVRPSFEAYNNLGECLLNTGNTETAYKCFLDALQIKPSPLIYNNLGMICIRQQKYDKALEHLRKALAYELREMTPQLEAALQYNMAQAIYRTKGLDAAAVHARMAIALIERGYGPAEGARELRAWFQNPPATNSSATP
ncbi:MAG: hypothetical protein C0404_13605 [Verrucomicrobia bacterium]|nr:hypothetical protein [Verrucomicrobiota bacterium]